MSKSVKRRARISVSSSNEGSRADPAAGTPVGGSGEAVPAEQRAKDDDPVSPPAGEGLRTLSARIVELLSAVTALVGQLVKEELVEGAASRGQRTGDSTFTADQRRNRISPEVARDNTIGLAHEEWGCLQAEEASLPETTAPRWYAK
ncbi:unnamed protein product [Lampetra fluviatilis]